MLFGKKKYVHITRIPDETIAVETALVALQYDELDEIVNAVSHVIDHAGITMDQRFKLDSIREKLSNCCISMVAAKKAEGR